MKKSLRFSKSLEKQYRDFIWSQNNVTVKILSTTFLLFLTFLLVNNFFITSVLKDWYFYVVRFAILVPVTIAIFVLSILQPLNNGKLRFFWYTSLSFYAIAFSSTTAIAVIFCQTDILPPQSCTATARPISQNVDFYSIIGPYVMLLILQTRRTYMLFFMVVYLVLFIISLILRNIETVISWLSPLYLLGAYILALSASYVTEKSTRETFLLREKLVQENTERIEAENRQNKAEEEKNAFASYIFHEIRGPLNVIQLSINVLDNDTDFYSRISAEEREFYDRIKNGLDAMKTVLDDTLDYQALAEGQIRIEPAIFDFYKLIDEVVTSMESTWLLKNVQFDTEIDSNMPRMLIGDKNRLRQVISNYVSNAVKFTSSDGKISLRVNVLEEDTTKVTFKLSVVDTGIGISQENIQKLFQPFVQIDPQIIQSGKGSGLGLSIVANIITRMKGRYGVISNVGKGSEFFFELTLPISASTENVIINSETAVDSTQKSLQILIVDDDELTRKILVRIFTKLGHKVTEAVNGQDCIEKVQDSVARNQTIDVIFIDNVMPIMTGMEAIKWLKDNRFHIPIVSLTSTTDPVDQREILRMGVLYILVKPTSVIAIQEVLRSVAANMEL